MNIKNILLAGVGAVVTGLGIVGVMAANHAFVSTSLKPDPLAAERKSRPASASATPSSAQYRPQDRGPACEEPSLTVTEPALGSTIGRTPVFVGSGLSPNALVTLQIDYDFYLWPAERAGPSVIESANPRGDGNGNFRLQLDLRGNHVVFTGAANAMGGLATRGVREGPHRFLITEYQGPCPAFSEELHYTVRDDA